MRLVKLTLEKIRSRMNAPVIAPLTSTKVKLSAFVVTSNATLSIGFDTTFEYGWGM